jgi:hypothetical protein
MDLSMATIAAPIAAKIPAADHAGFRSKGPPGRTFCFWDGL